MEGAHDTSIGTRLDHVGSFGQWHVNSCEITEKQLYKLIGMIQSSLSPGHENQHVPL